MLRQTSPNNPLRLRLLAATRVAIVAAAALAAVLKAISIPPYYSEYANLSTFGLGEVPIVRTNLSQAGLSVEFYAAYMVGLAVGLALACYIVSAVIFWRKPRDLQALVMALAIVVLGSTFSGSLNGLGALGPEWDFLGHSLNFLNLPLFYLIFLTFPNGRFVPGWTRHLYLPVTIGLALSNYFPGSILDQSTWPILPYAVFNTLTWATPVIAQIYRYGRASDAKQRQQMKWVVYGFGTSVFAVVALVGSSIVGDAMRIQIYGTLWDLLFNAALHLAIFLIPLSLAIAMLRSRLYDIDIIVNRTLVYAALTASLAAFYFGSVVLLEALLQPLTGQGHNDLVIVASTLLIAALFLPLRRAIQTFIDRRFYRRKYDAAKTLASFSATLRDEVDLHVLTERLLGVVDETMHPSHVALWLRMPERPTSEKPALEARR
jgi:hypothetical protein